MAKTALPPVLERHELKYAVPANYIEPITDFLLIYCDLDYYSEIAENHFYQVNSLYFDTRDHEFLRNRLYGKDGRFNMRARCYGDGGQAPYFLEIKRKYGFTGVKYRSVLSEDEWPSMLTDAGYRVPNTDTTEQRLNKETFLRVALSYAIEPKILTQYKRRAFVSVVDRYARATMDTNMRYKRQEICSFFTDKSMTNYDNETIYANNCSGDGTVILELKCNIGEVPTWMLDLISTFQLKQQGFSKYATSSLVCHYDDGVDYMTGDRVSTAI